MTFQEDDQYGTSPIEFMSSSNLPLSVLKLRKQYTHKGLIVGGFLETETQAWSGDKLVPGTGVGNTMAATPYQHCSTINVSSANFDVLANINSCTQAFIQYNAAGNTLLSAFYQSRQSIRPSHINTATVAYDQNNVNVNLSALHRGQRTSKEFWILWAIERWEPGWLLRYAGDFIPMFCS